MSFYAKGKAPASTLKWVKVDQEALSTDLSEALEAYRELVKAANEMKVSFEQAFIKKAHDHGLLKPSQTMVFGYKFGGLSFAVTTNDGPKKPKKADLFSFDD